VLSLLSANFFFNALALGGVLWCLIVAGVRGVLVKLLM
jgi:hypothetical protein